ncbi:MAG: MFS transporter, partial [Bacteroidota bacterium]
MTYASLVRKYPREILYGFLHFFFSGLGQTFLLGFFVASFTESLSITIQDFNGFYSGATLASAFLLPLAGKYLDKIKVRYFSLGIAVLMILFSLFTATLQYAWMLGIALFGLRFSGQGLMPLTGATATARYFEEGRGKALSLVGFGISLGEFLMPLGVTFLILNIGWRYTWLILALGVVCIFIPAIIGLVPLGNRYQLIQEDADEDEPTQATGATREEVLRDPKFYLLAMVNLWVAFFVTGVFINQSLLASSYGWSLELVAYAVSIFGLTKFISNIFFGSLIDKFSAVRVFSYVLLPLIAGCLLLMFTQSKVAVIIFFILCG